MECAKQSHFENRIIPILGTLNRPVFFGRVYSEEVSSNALSGDADVSLGIVVICQSRKFVSITSLWIKPSRNASRKALLTIFNA